MARSIWIIALLIAPTVVLAHGGGIDSRGGHRCLTDCEDKGYSEGQYHFHPNLMGSRQLKSYTRLRGAVCNRVVRRFSSNAVMLARVQGRVEKRFGFRCGDKTTFTKDVDGNASVNAHQRKRKTRFDIVRTRRSAKGAQVLKVIDGDTIEVREKDRTMQTVRLIGIDTPEVGGYGKKAQCFGKEASMYLKRVLARKNVELIAQPGDNRDKFGRLLRYVHLADGDVGLWMLNLGYARNYTWFEHPRMKEYKAAELEAQQKGRGIWTEC